jgi:hypothetical protein
MPGAPDLAGSALDGRYELRELIGEGAFGRVYRGFDRRLAREVAVKVIKPWWAEDSAWVERFQREAQLLARVSDPGIVQIFDIGHAEEGPYYVAELVAGESLAERLPRGRMELAETLAVAEQLCRALASAHAQGIVHCDVKPANVLLSAEGKVKVGDFGVARLAGGTSQALSATVAGTPRYMAPEQARGRATSPATDVYSAGVVLYEMLTGEPPFLDGSAVELGLRHVQDEPPPLPASVPGAVRELVERALEKEPSRRFGDGATMAAALSAVASGSARTAQPSAAGRAPLLPRAAEPSDRPRRSTADVAPTVLRGSHGHGEDPRTRRRRIVVLLAAAVLIVSAVLLVWLLAAGGRTTVPDLRGLPRAGVQARAKRLHVRPAFSSRPSTLTAAGRAISQSPAAGTRVADDSTVHVVLSAGPPPVAVPSVLGQASASAEHEIASAGLRYRAISVPAPSAEPGLVTRQSPRAGTSAPHGSTVTLSIAEQPRWRLLTTFSGVKDGSSVPVRIEGRRWRVTYSMSYVGSCSLLLVCFGPSAQASDLHSGAALASFDLSEGSAHGHTYESGPGLYRVKVTAGRDAARWRMNIQDYY